MNNGSYAIIISVINMEMPQRKPNRIEGYDYSQNGAYFVTVCTRDRKKILSDIVGDDAHIVPSDSSIQHIFDEDAVAHGGVVDKDMGDGTYQFTILNNRTAGHADVKCGAKFSTIFILSNLLKDILLALYNFLSASCISYSLR